MYKINRNEQKLEFLEGLGGGGEWEGYGHFLKSEHIIKPGFFKINSEPGTRQIEWL